MRQDSLQFLDKAHAHITKPELRQHMDRLGVMLPQVRDQTIAQLGNFEQLREHVKSIKNHTLENLDYYLTRYEEQVIQRGGQVHWARDADEFNACVLEICEQHQARRVGKGKSMVTEETDLTGHLQRHGLEVTETDLGEYIIQLAGEPPSHIVGPAFHKSVDEIRELFLENHDLGKRELEDPDSMVQEARQILRAKFLAADIGIIGANALIAEDGRSMLVTNEGNGDLVSTLPKVQIVCATIDKVLPRPEDATALLRLLVRSATASIMSAYTSFYCGPKQPEDLDGPEEFHVVLLDNQRSEILGSDYEEMLRCMRCGACMNHCPVYIAAGGHAYGWVYPGPMGSVLTPLLTGLEQSHTLPNACTTCGRCAQVCPSAIPLPDLLRNLRAEERERGLSPRGWRVGLKSHSWLAARPRLYQALTGLLIRVLHKLGKRRGALRSLLVNNGWTQVRDFPAPQGHTFMQQWKQQSAEQLSMKQKSMKQQEAQNNE
jgi:L-lactate dehydrogenase complex protein LldF